MTMIDYFKNIPDYYRSMYLDGYTPEQIMYVAHRKMINNHEAHKEEKKKSVSEVKIMRMMDKSLKQALDDIFKCFK